VIRTRPLTVAPVLALVLLLSACGGSGDEQAAATGASPSAAAPSAAASQAPAPAAPSPAGQSPAGSAEPSAGASLPADRAAFVTEAELVCKTVDDQLDALPEPTSPEQAGATLSSGVALQKKATTRLEQLAEGRSDAEQVNRIFLQPLRKQTTVIETFVAEVNAALKKGPQEVLKIKEPALPKADSAAMKKYGFSECVKFVKN